MSDGTGIEWTDATWNPITGCSVVSPGCQRCYAMKLAGTRLAQHPSRAGLTVETKAGPVWTGEVRLNEGWLDQPLRWRRPRRVFVCAHGDLFHEAVPDEWIDLVFAVMALAPWHTFQVLTKRAERMRGYLAAAARRDQIESRAFDWLDSNSGRDAAERWYGLAPRWPLPNVWLGVSVEDQPRANERTPHLLATPAAVRWVSAEPLLGEVDFTRLQVNGTWVNALAGETWLPGAGSVSSQTFRGGPRLDWIVVGGESGTGARPMHPAWARSLRDQCTAAGVAYFFKQWGSWAPFELRPFRSGARMAHLPSGVPINLRHRKVHHFEEQGMVLVDKADAGRLLDGVLHDAMPGVGR